VSRSAGEGVRGHIRQATGVVQALGAGRTPVSPGGAVRRVAVRLPEGTAERFEQNWVHFVGRVSAGSSVAEVAYSVKRGDNLGSIARRHGVTVAQLRQLNGLRGDRIYAGQRLRIGH